MNHDPEANSLGCSLSDAALREREGTLVTQFRSHVIATEELPLGFAFHISGDKESIRAVAEFIAAERECCRFLAFELTAEPNLGSVIVRVTGPCSAKELLKTIWHMNPISKITTMPGP